MEELATGEFIRRRDNLVMVGQSGVGKEPYRPGGRPAGVRAGLARALHDQRRICWNDLRRHWPTRRCRSGCEYYASFDLLIIDEFGFDRIERTEVAAGGEPAVQGHRRAQRAAFDGAGDEHRLRGLGRVPGRCAVGDGVAGSRRGRGDHPEDRRQVLSGASRPTDGFGETISRDKVSVTLAELWS